MIAQLAVPEKTVEKATLIVTVAMPHNMTFIRGEVRLRTSDGREGCWRTVSLFSVTGPDNEDATYAASLSLLWLTPRMLPRAGDWIEVDVRDKHVKNVAIAWGY